MADHLSEFPDGGRANAVRRYSPPLTQREFCLLAMCPYELPGHVQAGDRDRRLALKLAKAGLLERGKAPENRDQFRQTSVGQDVARRWRELGWSP